MSKYVLRLYVIQCVSRTSILSISWLRTLCPCVKVLIGNGENLQRVRWSILAMHRELTERNSFQECN